jgi:GNAT superfamily N-acetyltransferase
MLWGCGIRRIALAADLLPKRGIQLIDLVIRHAEAGDYKAIITIVDDWWGGRRMVLMLPKLFFVQFRPTSFVAEHDGLIVGFVIGFISQTHRDEGYIHFVGVHPNFRKRGLGHLLYEQVFEALMREGCRIVRCVTSPFNKGSITFHLRMGFKPEISKTVVEGVPFFEDYDGPGEDRVLFSKILSEPDQ